MTYEHIRTTSIFELLHGSESRLCVDRDGSPLVIGTLYLGSLTRYPRNTVLARYAGMAKLYAHFERNEVTPPRRFEDMLMSGEPLSDGHLRGFSLFVEEELIGRGGKPTHAQIRTINKRLVSAAQFEAWCLRQFAPQRWRQEFAHTRTKVWQEVSLRGAQQQFAEDFTDEEIREIDHVLRGMVSANPDDRSAATSFLMWRFAIEYGLRIGEILGLRVEDLPTRTKPYLRIVRLSDRGGDMQDPRGKYQPSPKTLGRDLGQWFANSAFPRLSEDYVSRHRWTKTVGLKSAKVQRTFMLDHPYLLVTRDGAPLSGSSAQHHAHLITQATGIAFHWHKARHSFFNRAYLAMLALPGDEQARARDDLRYWGGWSTDESLSIYTQTARRHRARQAAFTFSSKGASSAWEVLGG